MFGGQIDALLHTARDEIDRDEDEQHRRDADDGEKTCLERLRFHRRKIQPARCARRITLVVKREKTITERKKSMSRESSTPFWIASK